MLNSLGEGGESWTYMSTMSPQKQRYHVILSLDSRFCIRKERSGYYEGAEFLPYTLGLI